MRGVAVCLKLLPWLLQGGPLDLDTYDKWLKESWVADELFWERNIRPGFHWGMIPGEAPRRQLGLQFAGVCMVWLLALRPARGPDVSAATPGLINAALETYIMKPALLSFWTLRHG